jgi:hypothetical protein
MLDPDLATQLERYATGLSRPATFLERGITLPFTTPALLGGRVRPAQRRSAELVLANPSGSEGVYILPWAGVLDFCSPTLHDRAVWARVSDLPHLVPRQVREAARAVAAEGYAGREAARAAAAARAGARQDRTLAHYGLLLELVRQGEAEAGGAPARRHRPPPEADTPAGLQARAREVLERLRTDGRIAPAAALDAIEEMAEVFEACGVRRGIAQGRLPALADAIAAMAVELVDGTAAAAATERLCCRLLSQSAELVLRCGRLALNEAHGLLDDIWALLQRWRMAPDSVQQATARAEWIFDGWDMILGLWRGAAPGERGAAVLAMANLVPMIPAEVENWFGFDATSDMEAYRSGLRRWRRTVQVHEDWATGRIVDGTFRTEQLRALCA